MNDRDARNDGHADREFDEMDDARRNDADWMAGMKDGAGRRRRLRRPRNTTACVALMNNGLLEMRGSDDDDADACEGLVSPACEYRCKYTMVWRYYPMYIHFQILRPLSQMSNF